MKSVLTKYFTVNPIQLIILFIVCYYNCLRPNLFLKVILIAYIILCLNRRLTYLIRLVIMFSTLMTFLIFFQFHQKSIENQKIQNVQHIRLVPDSIQIDGDQLSAQAQYRRYTVLVHSRLKSKTEKIFFQNNKDWLELKIDSKVEEIMTKRNFKGFDYKFYLKNKNIYHSISILSIKSISYSKPKHLIEQFQQWRRMAIIHSFRIFPEPLNQYLAALLFGYLDKSFQLTLDTYSQLGIIHFFALSGMHADFFLKVLKKNITETRYGSGTFVLCYHTIFILFSIFNRFKYFDTKKSSSAKSLTFWS
ncbi:DNA internalization competence protein ComEC/Rec2-like protein [Streptococcus urinalis]|uniref:Competence domain protein n=2 Tax=Streptococcus urinalis TaxID=149016 RepID=G5KDJ1_9STRE|nr:competence domain protein [Streptococcus urinalis 2285-97]VEF31509.1 DNA internalization competence protein ComEC/Rec2-like protein [Streptococcus urinalis]